MARSVADLVLAMDVLAAQGGQHNDPSIPPVPWRKTSDVAVSSLRIAMYLDDGYFKASPAIRRVVEEAADALLIAGAQVEHWTPPDVSRAVRLYFSILTADGAKSIRRALGPDKATPQIRGILQSTGMLRPMRDLVATIMQVIAEPGKDKAEQTALQMEKGSTGLPVGVQVVARHWREDIALAVMGLLESHFKSNPDYPTLPQA